MDMCDVITQFKVDGYKGKELKNRVNSVKNGIIIKTKKYAIYRIA